VTVKVKRPNKSLHDVHSCHVYATVSSFYETKFVCHDKLISRAFQIITLFKMREVKDFLLSWWELFCSWVFFLVIFNKLRTFDW